MNWVFTPIERRPSFSLVDGWLEIHKPGCDPQSWEEALEWSIYKYECCEEYQRKGIRITDGLNFSTCGCCLMWMRKSGHSYIGDCGGCPIKRRSGQTMCCNTPWVGLYTSQNFKAETDYLKDTLIWYLDEKQRSTTPVVEEKKEEELPKTHFVVWREGMELKPGEVALRLVQVSDHLSLEQYNSYSILCIRDNGTLDRFRGAGVPGLQLDGNDRIIERLT